MKTATDPKKTLEALLAGDSLPFDAHLLEKARVLAAAPAEADPHSVGELPEPLSTAVLEAAVRARAYSLAEALSASSQKDLAKAAKKALYRLRSLGFAVPEKKSEPSPPPSSSGPADESPPSVVSAITGTGERGLLLARLVRGRVEVLQIVFSDEHGVVELQAHELSRGSFRKVLKDTARPGAPASMQISLGEAKALLAEAVRANLDSRTPFPEGLDAALRHLAVTPAEHPLEVPVPEDGDAALAAGAAVLHDDLEIASWLPPAEEIQKLALKADEVATSNLFLDENQRAQQLSRTLHALVDGFFTAPIRRLYARRLWRMGELYQRIGRTATAQLAQAEARRLYHAPPGTPSAFALGLFEKVLQLSASARAPRTSAAAPEPRKETERRSPGGLILP